MTEYICPNCNRPIYDDDAILCHFCGGSLNRSPAGFISGIRYGSRRLLWFFVIFFIILGFILLASRY